jgi:hypothetical protein
MNAPVPFSEVLRDIRARAAAPHPDAELLIACDRFEALQEERHLLYREQAPGYMKRIRETAPELDALDARIAKTPARTADGRRAKAAAASHLAWLWAGQRSPAQSCKTSSTMRPRRRV